MSSELRMSGPVIFFAGIVTGLILGWVFEGVIGILVRAIIVIGLAGSAYVAYRLWSGTDVAADRNTTIEDADWHDLDPRSRK